MTTSSRPRKPAGAVAFDIPIAPVPAARVKHSKWGAYYPPTYETYRKAADLWLRDNLPAKPILTGPLALKVTFVCRRPKKPTHSYPRGDIDNFEKALYDAITNAERVWKDDVQIVAVTVVKRYAREGEKPHTKVSVTPR